MTAQPIAPASVGDHLRQAAVHLSEAGIEAPRQEAARLLATALGTTREWVLAHPEQQPAPERLRAFAALVSRRQAREPLAYIQGQREFYGRVFAVSAATLIPRPETEQLVELGVEACRRAQQRGQPHPLVVDLGAGCGAIAISVALACPQARLVGIDVSLPALRVAQGNARRLGAQNVMLLQADLLAALRPTFDVLLANLPYLPAERWPALQLELHYEPRAALVGGPRGTEVIERALEQASALAATGAELALEIDETQGEQVLALARQRFPSAQAALLPDLAGLDRVLHLRLP